MKKLSKILTVVFAFTLLLTVCFAGCSDEKPAESNYNQVATLNDKTTAEIYSDIMDTIDAYGKNFTTNVNYDIPCKVSMSYSGQSQSFNMTLKMYDTFKMAGDNFYEYIYVDAGEMMDMPLGDMHNEVWFVDNTAYMDVRGELAPRVMKAKYNATLEAIAYHAEMDLDELMNPVYDFSQSDFEDVVFHINKKDASDVYFEIVMDGAKAQAFAQKVVAKNLGSNTQMQFSKINYKFVIDETGALDHIDVNFPVKTTMNQSGYNYTYNYTYKG